MSGIVGIINLNGGPVDRRLLWRMTDSMAFRGPDAQEVWNSESLGVGLGHTLLRATDESARERQPFSFDGDVYIVADARIDDRETLVRKLNGKGCNASLHKPDVELILHAYLVWQESCVEHLLGDFAFAIWDERRQTLFCARDHFGVKPFYYSQTKDGLIFSNTLNCLRLHPAVSDELNEQALGDFLLAGYNHRPETTFFAEIQRLPPACSLSWSPENLRLRRYWELPRDGQIRYRRATDYVDHFRELFGAAVEDRLRSNRVWAWMSGGLDSTSIVALAHERLSKQKKSFVLGACTEVYDTLLPDDERHYAGLVAKSLGLQIHFQVLDDYVPFERWEPLGLHQPEPSEISFDASESDELKLMAAQSRVVLCGYGGDPGFSDETFPFLLRRTPLLSLLADVARHVAIHRRPPPLGLRRWLRNRKNAEADWTPYPDWLNAAFAAKLDLPARWRELNCEVTDGHRLRLRAHSGLDHPFWAYRFESHDPGSTFCPVEVRYPFFDRRVLEYLLAIPAIPWCTSKFLLREAMRGLLPEPVRLRPKTPLAADPIQEALKRYGAQKIMQFKPVPRLAEYVDLQAISQLAQVQDMLKLWVNIRVYCLNRWLYHLRPVKSETFKEKYHGLSTQRIEYC